jgi:anthranilate phosphoribosyltransferase
MSEITKYLNLLADKHNLSEDEASRAFQIVMLGGATPAQIAALLMGLRIKGETIEEITGAALAMRARSGKISAPLDTLDTCGTGGDNQGTLNVSTAVAFVIAGCGIPVAKHGNRAISSASGSADVLTALGVNINADDNLVEQSLREAHICFMMAPKFHTAMRHVAPIRTEMGIRTAFNLLGPLCSPAASNHHLLGVYSQHWVEPLAKVLAKLGSKSAWVVHGADGMDELTITGPSHVAELKDGVVRCFEINPGDAGLPIGKIEDLQGDDAHYNARKMLDLLHGYKGAYRDIVLLNSAAALIVMSAATDLASGVSLAANAIDSGKALEALHRLVEISNRDLMP